MSPLTPVANFADPLEVIPSLLAALDGHVDGIHLRHVHDHATCVGHHACARARLVEQQIQSSVGCRLLRLPIQREQAGGEWIAPPCRCTGDLVTGIQRGRMRQQIGGDLATIALRQCRLGQIKAIVLDPSQIGGIILGK
ncbi:hypothetical protein G6F40_015283 [Rhizopus arrhizus]|nr:hypothetical protein G6F40_015283 [Rhizopus arrhizus]